MIAEYATGEDIWQWRCSAISNAAGFGFSAREVDWLLIEVTGLDSLALHLGSYKEIAKIPLKRSLDQLSRLWQEHLENSLPLQYVAGSLPWRNLTLKVNSQVLIPRPETEFLIDIVEVLVEREPYLKDGVWVDLGTGSGAIAIALACLLENAQIYAIDTSPEALSVASDNVGFYNLNSRITLLRGSWWSSLDCSSRTTITGMISNPPYIPSGDIQQLESNVKDHEPLLALDGGEDGLRDIRYLVESAPDYLCSGGVWLIELMIGQARTVVELLQNQGNYKQIEIYQDFNDVERYVLARRK